MDSSASPTPLPRAVIVGLVVGWIVIVVKCAATPFVIAHWRVPIHPGWVIVPTLLFAGLATALVVAHDWTRPRKPPPPGSGRAAGDGWPISR